LTKVGLAELQFAAPAAGFTFGMENAQERAESALAYA
jgi:hypothetical protein